MKLALSTALALAATSLALTAKDSVVGNHTFTIPEGFEITKVAGPPLVDRPIVGDFDEEGHLYIADSAGVNDKVEKQLAERPHRIMRLTDTNGDGIYDKSKVFADKMMFPEGLLYHDGAVYCAAPPIIWKLEDTDDDGVADKRTEWFDVGTLTGCANDLHGPYLSPTGWIYWTKGAFAQLDLTMGDGTKLTDSAAHLFRARADGTGLESYAAGGMDNPVEITFSETGDAFFTSTFLVHPGNGQRDGLIHSIYGSVYPKRHGVIDGLPRTGELMPAMTHLGPAAPSGLTAYQSETFGPDYKGNLFSTLFNMRKVMRHVLVPDGASFRTEDSDFVASDQVDFHPTDVIEDADGSLLVLDTGGWYKLCCPTSVIAKPEVLGGIYRLRKTGAASPDDPRGSKIGWSKLAPEALIAFLSDSRPVVRKRAIQGLAALSTDALPALLNVIESKDKTAATGAVWALSQMQTEASAALLRVGLKSSIEAVKQAAAHACGLQREASGLSDLIKLVESGSPATQRAAATALGRLKDSAATPALLKCKCAEDRFLEHAIIYALIEINHPESVRRHLPPTDQPLGLTGTRALIALDQMASGDLKPDDVLRKHINPSEPVVEILKNHPEWESEVAQYIDKALRQSGQPGALVRRLPDLIEWPAVARVVNAILLEESLPAGIHANVRRHLGGTLPDVLLPALEKQIQKDPTWIELLANAKVDQLTPTLEARLTNLTRSEDEAIRQHAIQFLARCGKALPDDAFDELVKTIGTSTGDQSAARALSQAKLSNAQLEKLIACLPQAGMVEFPLLLTAFKAGGSAALAGALAEGIAQSPSSRAASSELLTEVASTFPKSESEAILSARPATPTAGEVEARLKEVIAKLPEGNRLKGHQVFKSAQAACATCHQFAYVGGKVGPDLTRIGAIRSRRDLIEAIVAPSASYARGYEPMIVSTKDGRTAMGILAHEAESITVRDIADNQTQIDRTDIQSIQLAPVSLMPAGIDQNLTLQQLADLIAFLESLR